MQICSRCNHKNRDGIVLCERCGQTLENWFSLSTRKVANASETGADFAFRPATKRFSQPGKIKLQLQDADKPIIIDSQSQVIIGRVGVHTVRRPDIDLSDYDAFRKGVSSLHAAIYRIEQSTYIADMGSLNGTYLNREGLTPHIRYILRSGDLIHLGEMAMQLFF
jgi:pSer/pThr/pTyr-binding forkhead associated (FHA) protein